MAKNTESNDEHTRLIQEKPRKVYSSVNDPESCNTNGIESRAEYKKRWRSIRIVYFVMFFSSVQFAVVMSSLWPYLQKVDSSISETFLGWTNSGFSMCQFFGSFLFGIWCQHRPAIEPLLFSHVILICGSFLYGYAQSFTTLAPYIILFGRLLLGFSTGNVAVCRAFLSESTTLNERVKAFADLSIAQALGFFFGPVMQVAVVPVGKRSYYVKPLRMYIDIFTLPGYLGVIIGIICLIVILCYFRETNNEVLHKEEKDKQPTGDIAKPDFKAIGVMSIMFFVLLSIFSLNETIMTPLVMDEFAWTDQQAVLYGGILLAVSGIIAVLAFQLVKYLAKWFGERRVLAIGLLITLAGFIVYLPWGNKYPVLQIQHVQPDHGNSSTIVSLVGCPVQYSWCRNTPKIYLPQFLVGAALVGTGYPIGFLIASTIYSQLLGPRKQGAYMAWLTSVGSLARIIGPLIVSIAYKEIGPRWTFLIVDAVLALSILLLGSGLARTQESFKDDINTEQHIVYLLMHCQSSYAETQDGYKITLRTDSFRIEGPSPICKQDYLMIYDGRDSSANSFKSPYCERDGPTTLTSSTNVMFFRFVTDSIGEFSGFNIEFTAEPSCNHTINADNGTITSPRYPNDYYSKANCVWQITTRRGTYVSLKFKDFLMEGLAGGIDQCYDYVSIYDVLESGEKLLKTYCGDKIPDAIQSTNNQMIIKLYSDATVAAREKICSSKELKCKNGACIGLELKCDGQEDCIDGEDEVGCGRINSSKPMKKMQPGENVVCNSTQFNCNNARCVDMTKRCDQVADCVNATDELNCADIDECAENNGNCGDICTNFPGGFKCECSSDGFEIGADGKSCQDINECLNNPCMHECENTIGSYRCKCRKGYRISSSGKCLDINECAIGVPSCFDCINTDGSSKTCVDVDECAVKNGGCEHLCINHQGSYSCECYPGFQLLNGTICKDINECSPLNVCQYKCINTIGSFQCECPKDFVISKGGRTCYKKVNGSGCGMLHSKTSLPLSNVDWLKSKAGAWVWQAYMVLKVDSFQIPMPGCMATLISKQYLITTAHCVLTRTAAVIDASKLLIYLGDIATTIPSNNIPYEVEKIIMHPDYRRANRQQIGDLAIIKLTQPVKSNTQPICLNQIQTIPIGEKLAFITWGRIEERRYSGQLRQVNLEIKENSYCSWLWRKRYDYSKIFCAGFMTMKVKYCLPDSGSPLMFRSGNNHNWLLAGILVRGAGYSQEKSCSLKYKNNAFYDLSHYYKWIAESISESL
eukprot:gene7058-7850_t